MYPLQQTHTKIKKEDMVVMQMYMYLYTLIAVTTCTLTYAGCTYYCMHTTFIRCMYPDISAFRLSPLPIVITILFTLYRLFPFPLLKPRILTSYPILSSTPSSSSSPARLRSPTYIYILLPINLHIDPSLPCSVLMP